MKFLEFLNESTKSISVSTKDWERMIDVILKGKSFDGVIKTIKDKNKAAARFIAVQKLKDENDSSEKSFENSEYSGFYKKSIDQGATYEEIKDAFEKTVIPDQIKSKFESVDKIDDQKVKDVGFALTKAGYDFNVVSLKGGRKDLTRLALDYMSGSGRWWTDCVTIEIAANDERYTLSYNIVTSESVDSNTRFFILENKSDRVFKRLIEPDIKKYGVRDFTKLIIETLNDLSN